MRGHKNDCLVCGKPLHYFEVPKELECVFCHKTFLSQTACEDGHYVCDACHSAQGIQTIRDYCLSSASCDPIAMAVDIMKTPYIYMHGPEHHVLVGAVLLTAYKNSGGKVNFADALEEITARGREIPGGACGFWGVCGAAVSAGIYVSVITEATPLTNDSWALSNQMTSEALAAIASVGGPRCCKRDSFLAIEAAAAFTSCHFDVNLSMPEQIICQFARFNHECIGRRCPYIPRTRKKEA